MNSKGTRPLVLKNKTKYKRPLYSNETIISVSKDTRFIISKLVLQQLNINRLEHGLIIEPINDKLFIKKGHKSNNTYNFRVSDRNTYIFYSKELYEYLISFFKLEPKQNFTLRILLNNQVTLK